MTKPKYKQGKQIRSISEFSKSKCVWFKWNGKTRHRSVLESLQYSILDKSIKCGRIYTAESNEPQEKEGDVTNDPTNRN